MNRQQRRAKQAQERKQANRAATIAGVMHYLAHATGPTATGATVFLPDREIVYVSKDTALAATSDGRPEVTQ